MHHIVIFKCVHNISYSMYPGPGVARVYLWGEGLRVPIYKYSVHINEPMVLNCYNESN